MSTQQLDTPADEERRNQYLLSLGIRVRGLRSQRGLTRKAVAQAAGISERHLANLELGTGNASVLVLLDVAHALQCTMAELVGDVTTSTPEWLMLRDLLSPLMRHHWRGFASPPPRCWDNRTTPAPVGNALRCLAYAVRAKARLAHVWQRHCNARSRS